MNRKKLQTILKLWGRKEILWDVSVLWQHKLIGMLW